MRLEQCGPKVRAILVEAREAAKAWDGERTNGVAHAIAATLVPSSDHKVLDLALRDTPALAVLKVDFREPICAADAMRNILTEAVVEEVGYAFVADAARIDAQVPVEEVVS